MKDKKIVVCLGQDLNVRMSAFVCLLILIQMTFYLQEYNVEQSLASDLPLLEFCPVG